MYEQVDCVIELCVGREVSDLQRPFVGVIAPGRLQYIMLKLDIFIEVVLICHSFEVLQ